MKILVVVAHRDDETIGLGGTIARHVSNGDLVYCISMTDGVGARKSKNRKIEIETRKKSSLKAGKILGLSWIDEANFPDNALDTVSLLSIVKFIEKAKLKIKPSIIYTHSSADLNIDHQIVSKATLVAFRPHPNEFWQEIRAFEIPSATDYGHKSITGDFNANLYIDISKTWKKKLKALKEYKTEIKESPYSRSLSGLENLAKHRGHQVGVKYAEAFEIIRKIQR